MQNAQQWIYIFLPNILFLVFFFISSITIHPSKNLNYFSVHFHIQIPVGRLLLRSLDYCHQAPNEHLLRPAPLMPSFSTPGRAILWNRTLMVLRKSLYWFPVTQRKKPNTLSTLPISTFFSFSPHHTTHQLVILVYSPSFNSQTISFVQCVPIFYFSHSSAYFKMSPCLLSLPWISRSFHYFWVF